MRLTRRRRPSAEAPPGEDTAQMLKRTLRHPNSSHLDTQLFEIVETRTYLQHGIEVREGDVVLDVGANVGVAAAFFATECRAGVVHCFEPVLPIFELLQQNLRDLEVCVPHNYGLSSSSRSDTVTYYPEFWAMSGTYADPDIDRANLSQALRNLGASEEQAAQGTQDLFSTSVLPCDLRTLSEVLRTESIDRVDLLKLDVEKAELDVLTGIDDPDWHSIRQVAGELHLNPEGRSEVTTLLRDRGFDVTVVQEPMMKETPIHLFYALRR